MQDGGAWFFRQTESIQQKAEELSAKIAIEFSDHGKPSNPAKRPGLRKLLKYVAENKVDYVIVPHMGMLSRSAAQFLEIAEQIKQAGAELVSTRGKEDDKLVYLSAEKHKIFG